MKAAFIAILLFIQVFVLAQSSILWEVTGPKIKSLYLMGTMHIANEQILNLHDSVFIFMKKSKVLALELNMNKTGGAAMALKMMKLIKMPKDTSYADLLSRSDLIYLNNALKEQLAPPFDKVWAGLRPAFVGLLILQQDSNLNADTALLPLDIYLYQKSKDFKMKHKGLETMEEQLAALNATPLKAQAESLLAALKDTTSQALYNDLLQAYIDQDIDALYQIIHAEEGNSSFKQNILTNRNYSMTDKMLLLAKKKRTFVAVGAGHLGGEEGILALLKKQGYTLRPVQVPYR